MVVLQCLWYSLVCLRYQLGVGHSFRLPVCCFNQAGCMTAVAGEIVAHLKMTVLHRPSPTCRAASIITSRRRSTWRPRPSQSLPSRRSVTATSFWSMDGEPRLSAHVGTRREITRNAAAGSVWASQEGVTCRLNDMRGSWALQPFLRGAQPWSLPPFQLISGQPHPVWCFWEGEEVQGDRGGQPTQARGQGDPEEAGEDGHPVHLRPHFRYLLHPAWGAPLIFLCLPPSQDRTLVSVYMITGKYIGV